MARPEIVKEGISTLYFSQSYSKFRFCFYHIQLCSVSQLGFSCLRVGNIFKHLRSNVFRSPSLRVSPYKYW